MSGDQPIGNAQPGYICVILDVVCHDGQVVDQCRRGDHQVHFRHRRSRVK